jgi:hypothetical protein
VTVARALARRVAEVELRAERLALDRPFALHLHALDLATGERALLVAPGAQAPRAEVVLAFDALSPRRTLAVPGEGAAFLPQHQLDQPTQHQLDQPAQERGPQCSTSLVTR